MKRYSGHVGRVTRQFKRRSIADRRGLALIGFASHPTYDELMEKALELREENIRLKAQLENAEEPEGDKDNV